MQLVLSIILIGLIILIVYATARIINSSPIPDAQPAQPAQPEQQSAQSAQQAQQAQQSARIQRIHNIVEPIMRGTATIVIRNMDPELRGLFNDAHTEPVHQQDNENYEQFVNRNQVHNNDSENVHESQIVKELKTRYQRLMELNAELRKNLTAEFAISDAEIGSALYDQTQAQVQHLIDQKLKDLPNSERDIKSQKAYAVLKEFSKKAPIISLAADLQHPDPPSDADLFVNVWQRIQSSENKNNRVELETALVDQLIDCGKLGTNINVLIDRIRLAAGLPEQADEIISTVCPQGRVARLLQTFTMLDADSLLAKPILDDAEYRNEAFSKSYAVLQKALSADPDTAKLYEDIELTPEQIVKVENFKNTVREDIRTVLETDYSGLLSEEKINSMIQDACAGV